MLVWISFIYWAGCPRLTMCVYAIAFYLLQPQATFSQLEPTKKQFTLCFALIKAVKEQNYVANLVEILERRKVFGFKKNTNNAKNPIT